MKDGQDGLGDDESLILMLASRTGYGIERVYAYVRYIRGIYCLSRPAGKSRKSEMESERKGGSHAGSGPT